MGHGGVSTAVFANGLAAWYALMAWNQDDDGGGFPVDKSLANRMGVMDATLNSFK